MPRSVQRYSRWDRGIIWNHPAETHITFDEAGSPSITVAYWQWRQKGFECKYPVRYPATYAGRRAAYGSLKDSFIDDSLPQYKGIQGLLSYVEARKQIYLPVYKRLVRQQPKYKKLLDMLRRGKNLLIVEVDGPHQESLPYYKEEYGVDDSFIENHTMLATPANLNIMLHDEKHSFGHGYCLAAALLEDLSTSYS